MLKIIELYVLNGCILWYVNVPQLSCYFKTLMTEPISTQHCHGHMIGCHVTSAWLEMLGHRLSLPLGLALRGYEDWNH